MKHRIVLMASIVTLLPVPASAATTTFQAPYEQVTTSTREYSDSTPLSDGSATAIADATSGRVFLSAEGTSANPAGTGVLAAGAGGQATARFAIGSVTVTSGRIRVRGVVTGPARAEREVTTPGLSPIYAEIAAWFDGFSVDEEDPPAPPPPLVRAGDGRLLLAEEDVAESGPFVVEADGVTTEGGFCPKAPVTVDIGMTLRATAAASGMASAETQAGLAVATVTVEELPCEAMPLIESVDVHSWNSSFDPEDLTVDVGTTVQWILDNASDHSITADDGTFDSGSVWTGSYGFRFDDPGVFPYHCTFHGGPGGSGMAGTITVV